MLLCPADLQAALYAISRELHARRFFFSSSDHRKQLQVQRLLLKLCLIMCREAKEKNRESWYMAYIMDTNEEERAKGKTVEVGCCLFSCLFRAS